MSDQQQKQFERTTLMFIGHIDLAYHIRSVIHALLRLFLCASIRNQENGNKKSSLGGKDRHRQREKEAKEGKSIFVTAVFMTLWEESFSTLPMCRYGPG